MRGAATKIVAAEQTYLSAITSTLFCSVPPPVRNKRNKWNRKIGQNRRLVLFHSPSGTEQATDVSNLSNTKPIRKNYGKLLKRLGELRIITIFAS